jgi:hypothetical protein
MAGYRGWFWLCPVYVELIGNDGMMLEPRHWALAPLFWMGEAFESARVGLSSIIWPDWEPGFMVFITSEIPQQEPKP